jgi:hypothetical protein
MPENVSSVPGVWDFARGAPIDARSTLRAREPARIPLPTTCRHPGDILPPPEPDSQGASANSQFTVLALLLTEQLIGERVCMHVCTCARVWEAEIPL